MSVPVNANKHKKFELLNASITTLGVIIMGGVNIWVTISQNNEKLAFEKQNAESIFSLQKRDLFIKDAEQVLNEKQKELDFLKLGFSECNKDDESSFNRISSYADVLFSSEEKRNNILNKIRKDCSINKNIGTQTKQEEHAYDAQYYKSLAFDYINKNQYKEASQAFINATQIEPDNSSLWNFRAYSEFRSGNYNAAKDSISVAIKIGSQDNKTNKLMSINAAKILCAQGKISDGANYIQQAMNVIPGLYSFAKNDKELIKYCHINFTE
ncbi:tetratricopeptide repeat protein [Kosakonia quasisacchari]|uniref:tetratricopeptide repeat protein n=1 Tax=Kosakonia quasisacchari TaxID=2529380 RepID=UPI0039E18C1B